MIRLWHCVGWIGCQFDGFIDRVTLDVIAAYLGGLDVLFGGGQVVEVVENWDSCSGLNADGSLEIWMMEFPRVLYGIGKVSAAASEMALGLAAKNLGWVSMKSTVIDVLKFYSRRWGDE
jgi:hypothetical protein